MEMKDSLTINAPQDVVWAAVLNPDVLKACVPGCTELTGSPEEGFDAVVVQKVGPVKATFKGQVTVSDMDELNAVTLTGEGKGGAAGFAKGGARVVLVPEGEGTRLDYEVEAKVGGKLAQLGSRIIDGFAKKMADEFFDRFQAALDPSAAEEEAEDAEHKPGWFRRMLS